MTGMIETLERAAEICDEHSRTIRGDFYDTFIRRWFSQDMKAKHWECVALAKKLRKIAKYHKPNPLGGPARVFDAMADRIRAGDKFDDVLKDYGFMVAPKGKGKK